MKIFIPSYKDYSIGLTIGMTSAGLVIYLLAAIVPACTPNFTQADAKHVENHNQTIERCKAEGREAGTYIAYQACKDDAGIKDGVSP